MTPGADMPVEPHEADPMAPMMPAEEPMETPEADPMAAPEEEPAV